MKILLLYLAITFLCYSEIASQEIIPFKYREINYKDYIELVKRNNLKYASEKLNIDISEAEVNASKVFNDPTFSIDYSQGKEENAITGHSLSSEIGKTIDLSGERKARISFMTSQKQLTEALVRDYFRELRAEATTVYLHALQHKQLFFVRYNSYLTMKKLSESDSIRVASGSAMLIDAIQSRLEAGILSNDLTHAIAEWKEALYQLSMMIGTSVKDTFLLPSGNLAFPSKDFILDKLILDGLANRTDLIAAQLYGEVAQKELILKKKERITDIDLRVGYSNNYLAGKSSPESNELSTGISIPLKFSNIYRGEVKMAELRIIQADEMRKDAEIRVKSEILQAWDYYQDYCSQVKNFNQGLLKAAEDVRKGKVYSYQRGETSLLEVLNAQRTFNDIQTAYYEALFKEAGGLVDLEKAAGIWDIEF
jgi:outer membrane protein, heavy metal efflux system